MRGEDGDPCTLSVFSLLGVGVTFAGSVGLIGFLSYSTL